MVNLFGTKCLRNKKASIQDIVLLAGILLFLAIVLLIAFKIMSSINTEFQGSDLITTNAKTMSTQMTGYYSGIFDNAFLFLLVGLAAVMFVLAALVRIHPIFVPFFFLVWILLIFLSGILSNIYQNIAADPNFITEADQLTYITTSLTYFPIILGVFGIILMVVMYKQWQVSQFE